MKKFIIPLILIIVIGIGIFYFWFHNITSKIFVTHSKSLTSVNSIQQSLDAKTPIDIALLGYGGGNHDGAYLTDSIIVVHIDPKQQKVFLISIPRDTWVKIPDGNPSGGNYYKINASYEIGLDDATYPNKAAEFKGSDGGGHLAEYELKQVTGLPISYFVGMDFSGFKHTIDTLNGVDINVETTFTDPEYPIDGQEDNPCGHTQEEIKTFTATTSAETDLQQFFACRYKVLHFDKGMQHMDGQTALEYVRSRHSLEDGTDFGRAKRQRNLIIAVKQKVFSIGFISQVIPFMSSLGDDFKTDLSMDDVRAFLQNANVLNKYSIESLALTDQNYLENTFSSDGQAILAPKLGIDNFSDIHTYISDTITGKTPPVAATVLVENGTQIAGLATQAVDILKKNNIQTLDPGNADSTTQKTKIIVYNKAVDKTQLQTILKNLPASATVNYDTTTAPSGYNILVVLGNDFALAPTPTP
ncbi:MAG TPA: LCP family protein [Patescibacteria group bacterium]